MIQPELWICSNADYHADTEYVSRSGLKDLVSDPEKFYQKYVAKTAPKKPQTDAMMLGDCLDALVLDKEVKFVSWPGRRDSRDPAFRKFTVDNFGKHILTEKQSESVYGMAAGILANDTAMELLHAPGDAQIALKWEHVLGPKVKVRFDRLLHRGCIVDLKKIGQEDEGFFARQVQDFGYDMQVALYSEAAAMQLEGHEPEFHFVCCCSEPPYRCFVRHLPQGAIEMGRRKVHNALRDLVRRRKENDWKSSLLHGSHEVPMSYSYFMKGFT